MLILPLVWLVLGACVGALAVIARWAPRRWEGRAWWMSPALGAVAALAGGGLATLLLDHIFATLIALSVSVAVLTVTTVLMARPANS